MKYSFMARIKNETEYNALMKRVEELAPQFDDSTPTSDPKVIEYVMLSNLIEEYEEEHYPIQTPSLPNVIKLRMYEMGLTQTKLSSILGVSPSRISDYLSGKSEPTLQIGRKISKTLNIDANVVLGV